MRVLPLILLTTAVALFSCDNSPKESKSPFDPYFDFGAEVTALETSNPTVRKSVTMEGKTEVQVDTLADWTRELKPFLEANINQPNFRDAYQQEVEETSTGRTVTYTAVEDDLEIRTVALKFAGAVCQEIFIRKAIHNTIYESVQELTYVPGKEYLIKSLQKARFAFQTQVEVHGMLMSESSTWRAEMDLGGDILPFNFEMTHKEPYAMEIRNGEERILLDAVRMEGDSLFAHLPVFDSEIKAKMTEKGFTGHWYNYAKKNYRIPIKAMRGVKDRFDEVAENKPKDFSGKWEVYFSPNEDMPCRAIGLFEQNGAKVTGTFLTETGDYRYLEGLVNNDTMCLSTFDGSHAFFFKAGQNEKGELSGNFRSGTHWSEPFEGVRNEEVALRNPDSLTYVKEGYDKLAFSFPDVNGNPVSLEDEKYKNKVVIVEVMGSWCPNCKDGTSFLAGMYDQFNDRGLEVIALAYERSTDFDQARKTVLKHKNDLHAHYDFLIAGRASKKEAAESLPMLNKILSFPTTIFIDRKGEIRKIYTGFYGPGTGHYYQQFEEETTAFIQQLLDEGSSKKITKN